MKNAEYYWNIWLEATDEEQSAMLTFQDVIKLVRKEQQEKCAEAARYLGATKEMTDAILNAGD